MHSSAGGHLAREGSRPLAVLIVAYRSPDDLERCLASVNEFLPGLPIHVWDNSGSDFDGVREIAEHHPEVHWHLGGENIGFAAAVNRLAEAVPGYDLLLLNPDAELLSGLPLSRAAAHEAGVAAASPVSSKNTTNTPVRNATWNPQSMPWDIAYRRMTLLNTFGHAAGVSRLLRGTWFSQCYRSHPDIVDGFISAPCLIINREAWDEIGPFDEEFFLYHEEAEWQRRACDAGWTLRLVDEVGFNHVGRGTVVNDAPRLRRSQDLVIANAVLMIEYYYGRWMADVYTAFMVSLQEVKRRLRRRPRPLNSEYDVVVVASDADSHSERVATVRTLLDGGHSVCVVATRRLGALQRDLPPEVRLIRRPSWWPSISPQTRPAFLLVGPSRSEKLFGRLFRFTHPGTSVRPVGAADFLPNLTAVPSTVTPQLAATDQRESGRHDENS